VCQIICSWLNYELKVSQFIDESNFSSAFCNGYLIGEILRKYDLMDNFDKLSRKSSTEAKLNNFILLEPILKLLGLPFNNSIAKDITESINGVGEESSIDSLSLGFTAIIAKPYERDDHMYIHLYTYTYI